MDERDRDRQTDRQTRTHRQTDKINILKKDSLCSFSTIENVVFAHLLVTGKIDSPNQSGERCLRESWSGKSQEVSKWKWSDKMTSLVNRNRYPHRGSH